MPAHRFSARLRVMSSMGIERVGNAVTCLGLLCTLAAAGCTEADSTSEQSLARLGLPCVISSELEAGFSGFGIEEANVQYVSSLCGGELCVAYHFQGRASCPYGQSESDIQTLAATDPARCRVTDAMGKVTDQPVTVEVLPQLVDRRADKTVYCSCACSGTDPNRTYCTCPSGMQCEQLSYALPESPFMGYCVRLDSLYARASVSTLACSRTSTDPTTDCAGNRQNP